MLNFCMRTALVAAVACWRAALDLSAVRCDGVATSHKVAEESVDVCAHTNPPVVAHGSKQGELDVAGTESAVGRTGSWRASIGRLRCSRCVERRASFTQSSSASAHQHTCECCSCNLICAMTAAAVSGTSSAFVTYAAALRHVVICTCAHTSVRNAEKRYGRCCVFVYVLAGTRPALVCVLATEESQTSCVPSRVISGHEELYLGLASRWEPTCM